MVFALAALIWGLLAHSPAPIAAQGIQEPAWLAFGDLRGYIEPCGCDPATDLGGVARLKTFLLRERQANPAALVFDLGNNLGGASNASNQLKQKYLKLALAELPVTARLPEPGDAEAGKLLPLITANQGAIAIYRFVGGMLPKVEVNAKSYKILLFRGSDAELRAAQDSQQFDLIISGNAAAANKVIDNAENMKPELLMRSVGANAVRMVPLGGQGVLRGGALATAKAPSLSELLAQQTKTETPVEVKPWIAVTWLDKSYDTGAAPNKILAQYNSEVKKEFKKQQEQKFAGLKDTPYVGSACESCHPAAYKVWQNSKHARAFATLQEKKKDSDPNCVSCHVVGFSHPGGFVSLDRTKGLKDVGCESCHGPRREHIADPTAKPKNPVDAKAVCVTCHQGMHSPEFDYNKYWERIKHQ